MNSHRTRSNPPSTSPATPTPSTSSATMPGVDHRGVSPTSLLVCIASSIALAGLALLIQSDSPVIPAAIRTGTRLWKSAASAISDEQNEAQKKPTITISNAGQRSRQSSPQSTSPSQSPSQSPASKRGGRKQQRRRSNKDARVAAATAVPTAGVSVEVKVPEVPIIKAPQPPLHKSLQARATMAPVSPVKKRRPSAASPTAPPRKAKKPTAQSPKSSYPDMSSILNPRAAVYEFRAQYHQDPLSTLTTTATNTPLPAPQPIVTSATAPSPQPTSLPLPVLLPSPSPYNHQLYDAILVLDVEATCAAGSTFDYPNEIIEWPVLLMRWVDEGTPNGVEQKLVVVDDFRSYVRPTWRPQLTDFCKSLTGIDQSEIDTAPTFTEMLVSFESWLQKHGLIPPPTALLTPPASRCPSPVPAVKAALPLTSSPVFPHDSLFECATSVDSPSITISAYTTSSSSSSSPSSSSSSSKRSSYSAAVSSSSAMTSPATTYASLFSPARSPSVALQPEAACENREWDAYDNGYGGYGYGYQAEPTGPHFAWATDGPCDLRDFVVKQCFISKIPIPEYFLGDVIDVRRIVGSWVETAPSSSLSPASAKAGRPAYMHHGKRQSLNIPLQLQALSLGDFSGQQHRGIDDARNISRIIQALSVNGVQLESNMYVNPNRRWFWMAANGEVVMPPSSAVAAVVPPPAPLLSPVTI
ncbi:hypothetical protein FRB93_006304 [Tulasnella sp. JGI-2019a]|nr:hypothetical protein FRB93_006304 [Tulasnella sp. JGI-2019a]